MGNCQAIDAAALVIQHPSGKIERLYCSISASEVMRLNPGHYVSLIIPLPENGSDQHRQHQEEELHQHKGNDGHVTPVRFTRVKLLRANETLALGHAYRLVTTQEVIKVLRAKKYAKNKKLQVESLHERQSKTAALPEERQSSSCEAEDKENINHAANYGRRRPRAASGNAAGAVMRSKSWRPSLQSISEAGS